MTECADDDVVLFMRSDTAACGMGLSQATAPDPTGVGQAGRDRTWAHPPSELYHDLKYGPLPPRTEETHDGHGGIAV